MKIGKILGEIAGGAATIAVVVGIGYTIFTAGAVWIQNDFLHDFNGTVQASGKKLDYKAVEPYDPWPPFWRHDRDGHAEVRLNDKDTVYLWYDDLNSIEGKGVVVVADSKGKKEEFNEGKKYDGSTRKVAANLIDALNTTNSDGKTLREIVEEEIRCRRRNTSSY